MQGSQSVSIDEFLQKFISQTIQVDNVDFVVGKLFGCSGHRLALAHKLNPLHYYSCLCDQGFEKGFALEEARRYEKCEWKYLKGRIDDTI
jgi:hypothetical protein